jgi:glycosyltransferase involved in cell wall biosynthesis
VARARSVPGYLRHFRRWIETERPALVHANTLLLLPEATVAHRADLPVVVHVHEILERSRRGAIAARALRAVADSVVVPSHASAAALARAGVTSARVVHNGVPLLRAAPRRPHRPGLTVIGTVATVSPHKGSDLFLEACRRVRSAVSDVEFRMVGPLAEEPDRAWAEAQVAAARGEGIRWTTTDDVFDELADWDLFVLPSRQDAFPLVVLEAMAAGLAVVATRVGGIPEQVTPGTGVLVAPEDVDALARTIVDLVRHPDERRRLGAMARDRVARDLSLERQAALMDEAYRLAIAGSGAS